VSVSLLDLLRLFIVILLAETIKMTRLELQMQTLKLKLSHVKQFFTADFTVH